MVWIVVCIIAAVIICGWFAIGYVGFRTAICRGHELNINDREALKGTAWISIMMRFRKELPGSTSRKQRISTFSPRMA